MRLLPEEQEPEEALVMQQAGVLAQKRLARGVRLNHTEAMALIALQLQQRIHYGLLSVPELVRLGKNMLGRRHVLPPVPSLLQEIQVEGTVPDGGVFLVTVHDPICTELGDLNEAFHGSSLPIPSQDAFPISEVARENAKSGEPIDVAPAEKVSLERLYNLF